MSSNGFVESVVIEVLGALIAAILVGFSSFLASGQLWRTIRNYLRARLIRKTTGLAFTIIRCPIENDNAGAIGSEIGVRLETAFRVFAGWNAEETRAFQVVQLPLNLPSGQSTKDYDKAVETAKRWLKRANGDILIWGRRVKGESVGFIRLVGKDRKKGVVEERCIDFDKQATHFDDALATAIAYEAAQLTQVTLSEPSLSTLDALRSVSVKLRKLAEAEAPALSRQWRERMATEHRRLVEEIMRRTPDPEDLIRLEENARAEIGAISQGEEPRRYAEMALRIGILVRKRNWLDPNRMELDEAVDYLTGAASFFESVNSRERAAECALECLLVRRQQLSFLGQQEADADAVYVGLFREATRRVNASGLESQRSRLAAISYCYPPVNTFTEVYEFDPNKVEAVFRFIERVARFLDNEELLDFAIEVHSQMFSNVINCKASRCGAQRFSFWILWLTYAPPGPRMRSYI